MLEDTDAFLQKYKEQWRINNSNKLHCFLLTNSTVAEYSGFGVLYSAFKEADIYKGGNYEALNTELLSDDIRRSPDRPAGWHWRSARRPGSRRLR